MIRRILHTIFSLWLAMLLLFGVTPKEAVHAFAAHNDTEHRHDIQGPVIESEHHHCGFLSFQMMPFSAPPRIPLLRPVPPQVYCAFFQLQDERAAQQIIALRKGRGPPVG